jgi:RNA polymerase sigma-70 factor (ECF subfamily)
MPVKPPEPLMLGVTAIDGLRLGPAQAARAGANDTQMSETALIEAVRRGDAGSREALYHRYKRRVYALAVRIVGAMDAEEVAQEAFIRIFRGLPKFRGDAALSTWIYRLAVNAALSHRARRGPVGRPGSGAEGDARGGAGLDGDGELRVDGEGQAGLDPVQGDAVLRARLERALARLPTGYRTVVVLHDVEGLEHEEVAAILGCHVGTSKSQLHKARARLREILAADGITAAALEST